MKNIRCILAYSGTHYLGFQKTKMGPSIEQAVVSALETILRHPVKIQAASRTDRGVHAEGQVINFFSSDSWDLDALRHRLGGVLPKDIAPIEMKWAEDSFHPTLDSIGKEYHYHLCNSHTQLPFHRDHSWHVHVPLNLDLMRQGAMLLEGKHNFSAFTSLSYDDPVRHVKCIQVVELPENRLQIQVFGDRFLYKMVRTIAGTLVYVGCGKIALAELNEMIASGDRTKAGVTAPAHGLSLKRVFYS